MLSANGVDFGCFFCFINWPPSPNRFDSLTESDQLARAEADDRLNVTKKDSEERIAALKGELEGLRVDKENGWGGGVDENS